MPASPDLRDHVCLLYDQSADRDSYMGEFVSEGLVAREKVLWVAGDGTPEVGDLMARRGFDVSEYVDSGQLVVKDRTETYPGSGRFDGEAMLNLVRDEVRDTQADGDERLRITGELSWATPGVQGFPELFEYERALDELLRETGHMSVCQYDTRQLVPAALTSAVQAHRSVVCRRSQEVLDTPLLTMLVITRDSDEVLSLYGDVDNSNVCEFEAALSAAASSPGTVTLELTHLHYIDVAGLHVLERQATQLSESGDRLVLSSPPAFLKRVLELLDFDELIDVAE